MTAQKTPDEVAEDILRERAENFKDCYFSDPAAWTEEDTRWVVISFKRAFAQAIRDAREAALADVEKLVLQQNLGYFSQLEGQDGKEFDELQFAMGAMTALLTKIRALKKGPV